MSRSWLRELIRSLSERARAIRRRVTSGTTLNHRNTAIAAMIGSAACWGGGSVASKAALQHLDPIPLLLLQLASSTAILWFAVFVTDGFARSDRSARIAALAGILEPGLSYTLGTWGLALSSASVASTIGATEPVIILLLAAVFLRERMAPRHIIGAAGTVAGLFLIADPVRTSTVDIGGVLLVLGGTAAAAAYVLVSARFSHEVPPALGAARQQTVGLAVVAGLLVAVVVNGDTPNWSDLNTEALILAFASGAIQYALAFWLYLWGLKHLAASEAGLTLALIPAFGILGGNVFLSERLQTVQLAGSALIVATLILTLANPNTSTAG